jgi:hypothetical protein
MFCAIHVLRRTLLKLRLRVKSVYLLIFMDVAQSMSVVCVYWAEVVGCFDTERISS